MIRILLLTCFSLGLLWSNESTWIDQKVFVYAQPQQQFFGIARIQRVLRFDIYDFLKGQLVPVQDTQGYLTAVTADPALQPMLDRILSHNQSINLQGYALSYNDTDASGQALAYRTYTYTEEERGIAIQFSLEPVSAQLLETLATLYGNNIALQDYYKKHPVIRIIKTTNPYSKAQPPSLVDIMLSASLIGQIDQPLANKGIAKGNNYLSNLEKTLLSLPDYAILNNTWQDKEHNKGQS
jgi:hypothetical protein